MKVMQSGRQTVRRLIIFQRIYVYASYYIFRRTRTPGHLILGVLAKVSV